MASRSTPILQLIVILLTLMSAVEGSNQCPRTGNKRLKPIYGLTLLPIPIHVGRHFQTALRSLSHIAGARVAQHEINRRRDLIPGYRLEMIVESIGQMCSFNPLRITSTGLDTMVKYTVNPPCPPLVAVNGLSCNLQTSYLCCGKA